MALTLMEQPVDWLPVYNPITYRFSSDLTSQNNFEYGLEIQVSEMTTGGTFSSFRTIHSLKQPPRSNDTVTFDIHKYISNELSFNLDPSNSDYITSVFNAGDIHKKYRVIPSENYNSDFEWEFNSIEQYDDGGIARPAFKALSPLTGLTSLGSYSGKLAVVNLDSGNPLGEIWDGINFTIDVAEDWGATLKFTDALWLTLATGYTTSGTIKLTSKTNISSSGTTTDEKNAYNGAVTFQDYVNWNETPGTSTNPADANYSGNTVKADEYFARDGATTLFDLKFVTSLPIGGAKVMLHDYMWLNVNVPSYSVSNLKVQSDNGVFHFDLSHEAPLSSVTETLMTVGLGPKNLTDVVSGVTVISGALPIIDANTTEYSFWLSSGAATPTPEYSNKYTMTINDTCVGYDKYSILYLDQLGSFQSINFYFVKKDDVKIKRTDYTRIHGDVRLDHNGKARWGYDSFSRGLENIDTTFEENFTMTSDWLSDEESAAVQEMLLSPSTFLVDADSTITAINITNSNFTRKNRINDTLFNYTISFKNSQQNRTNI